MEHLTLAELRRVRNFTQQEMAQEIGVCRDTYISYEKNPNKMPIKVEQVKAAKMELLEKIIEKLLLK